ncbi:MAG: hypothetical protein WC277_08245, partial [Bacilli bacterium]
RELGRELGLELSRDNLEDLPDGGLLIRDVKLLAEGTWTDSAVGTPLFYPAHALEANATNWRDHATWSRHLGGVPRDITERVGVTENPRYVDRAVVGDIRLHGLTQKSRDTIALVKAGIANYVSVEHGGTEKWNAATRQYEADEITFYGNAIVNRGACAKCTLRGNEAAPEEEETTMDTKELEAKIEAMEREMEAIKAAATVTPEPAPAPKELEEALAAIEALTEKVKQLEAQPATAATTPGPTIERELGEVETLAVIDKETKTIRGY